jgi:hypothetical protein
MLLSALSLCACKKADPEAAPAPAEAATPAAEPSASPDNAPTTPAEPTEEQRLAADKQAKIQRALDNQKILDDADGQWATSATSSSTYATLIKNDQHHYEAVAATGVPDAENTSSDEVAWAPEKANAGIEWLELGYDKPVNATEVRVRQVTGPGAIIKIELLDQTGAKHVVWEGSDGDKYAPNEINWLVRGFEATPYQAKGVRLTLATNAIDNRPAIDAVQLVGK